MTRVVVTLLALFAFAVPAAQANEFELSFYTGFQTAPHANVSGDDPGNSVSEDVDFTPAWEGKPFEAPPYYGIRGTWWRNATFGIGLELNHTKVYADEDDAADNGFSRLEFTDGLNIITVNAFRRWPQQFGDWTPYVGGGIGVAFPHVDVESDGGIPNAHKSWFVSYTFWSRTENTTWWQGAFSSLPSDSQLLNSAV